LSLLAVGTAHCRDEKPNTKTRVPPSKKKTPLSGPSRIGLSRRGNRNMKNFVRKRLFGGKDDGGGMLATKEAPVALGK